MSYVPASNYYLEDAWADNGTNNIHMYSFIPYFAAGLIVWPCLWNASGNVQSPYSSWSGNISNTTDSFGNTVTGSGGDNQYANVACGFTSSNFTCTAKQVGSSVNAGNNCTATGRSWTFNITTITSNFTFVSSTNNSSSNIVVLRLPPASSSVGKVWYVCNMGNTNLVGIAPYTFSEPIDGVSVVANTMSSTALRLVQWACIGLTPTADGTKWCIVSYYGGNLPANTVYLVNGTTITSPIVTSSNSGTSKSVILPNPNWGKGNYLCVTTYQTSTTSYGVSGQFAIYTNGFFAQDTTVNKYFSLVPASDASGHYDHNMSIAFISDGSKWYIASVFDGQNCQIDLSTQARTHITSPIFITTSSDGGNPDLRVATGGNTAMPMYFKMNHTSSSNGFVIDSSGTGSGGYVCSQNNIRCYKNSGTLNYNAFAMIQAGVSSTVINFPVGMYPSAY